MSAFDGLGVKPQAADETNLLGLDAVIKKTASFIVEDIGEELISMGISTSGTNKFGISAEPVEIQEGKVTFKIGADKYYDFIDEGVNGVDVKRGSQYSFKYPKPSPKMIESLKSGWIAAKGISAIGGIDQTAYAIGTFITHEGIAAHNLGDKLFDNKFIDKIEDILDEALFRAVEMYFEKLEQDGDND